MERHYAIHPIHQLFVLLLHGRLWLQKSGLAPGRPVTRCTVPGRRGSCFEHPRDHAQVHPICSDLAVYICATSSGILGSQMEKTIAQSEFAGRDRRIGFQQESICPIVRYEYVHRRRGWNAHRWNKIDTGENRERWSLIAICVTSRCSGLKNDHQTDNQRTKASTTRRTKGHFTTGTTHHRTQRSKTQQKS